MAKNETPLRALLYYIWMTAVAMKTRRVAVDQTYEEALLWRKDQVTKMPAPPATRFAMTKSWKSQP